MSRWSPCGGGGLIAGCALALTQSVSQALRSTPSSRRVWTTPGARSNAGSRQTNAPEATSICDALLVPTPGELTFGLNRQLLAGGLAVSDDEVRDAMAFAFRHLKLVVEPGGAVALAAVLSGKLPLEASHRRRGALGRQCRPGAVRGRDHGLQRLIVAPS